MKNLVKNKIIIFEIIFLLLISLTPLFWFQKDHVILGLDSGYAIDHIKFFLYRSHTWMPNPNFGVDVSAEMGLLPLVALPALISYLGVPILDVQKIILVGWFLVLSFSIYIFLRELFPKKEHWPARIIGTLIYMYNFHLYAFWLQGEQPMLASYAILPLFTLILYRFAIGKTKLLKSAILLCIVYVLFSSGGIRGIPLVGPVFLSSIITFCYFGILNWKKEKFSYIFRFIFLFLLFIIISIPLNAYWILPFLATFSHEFNNQVTIAGGIEGAISWAKFISSYDSYLNLFRLQGDNNWYFFPFLWSNNYLVNPILIIASFIFPALAFLAPVLSKKSYEKKIIILFTILALVSLFMSAGAHAPFGEIYVFMMKHIPGFATFRSAYYKFMPTVYFSFAILIGFTVYSVTSKYNNIVKNTLVSIAIIFILTYNYPFFQNTNAAFNKPFSTMVKIPSYVTDFKNMINSADISGKTLVLPQTNTRATIKEYTWGYYGAFSLFALMTDKPFVQYDAYLFNDSANALISSMYEKLRSGEITTFNKIAGIAGIKYILLTKDVAYNYSLIPQEDPQLYEKILSNSKYFKKIWGKGEWIMYEIINTNIQNEINVKSGVSIVLPDTTSLNDYFEESENSYILPNQIESTLQKKLLINSEFKGFTCISCVLLSKQSSPELPIIKIKPDSVIYPFLFNRDNKNLSKTTGTNQIIDAALGLSLKRAAEIDKLQVESLSQSDIPSWNIPILALANYWSIIDTQLKSEHFTHPEYDLLFKLQEYIRVEKEILLKAVDKSNVSVVPVLKNSLYDSIALLDKIDSKIKIILNEKDWNTNFLYSIDGKVNLQNLNTNTDSADLEGIEDITFNIASGSSYFHKKEDSTIINVHLKSKTNLLIDKRLTNLSFPGIKKSCIEYTVAGFRWDHKYLLYAISGDKDIPKTIYVKMDRSQLKTQDTTVPSANFFTPDFTFDPDNNTGIKNNFEFTGQQNDSGANVYVCTNESINPELAINNIVLNQQFIPSLYSFNNISNINNPPIIKYKKISSTKYIIDIENANNPYILSFLQTVSPNWKLSFNGQELKDRFMINGFANAWYITKKGSYPLILEFYLEDMFKKGIIISFISIGLVLIYIILPKKKNDN